MEDQGQDRGLELLDMDRQDMGITLLVDCVVQRVQEDMARRDFIIHISIINKDHPIPDLPTSNGRLDLLLSDRLLLHPGT